MCEKISVIVPVYKVEAFLPACVDSILKQTYSNFELFLVDDGSPDQCGRICDDYATKDKRIKVIHKKNGGLSDARNVALDQINGKYLTFIDSDDYIHKDYLKLMMKCVERYNADVVQCDFTKDADCLGTKNVEGKKSYTVLHNEEILRSYLHFHVPQVYACGKLYRSELFKDVRFPFGLIDEDNYTTYKPLFVAKVFVNINRSLYFYRMNPDSIMHRQFSEKKYGILNSTAEIREYVGTKTHAFDADIDYYDMRELIQIYNNALQANAEREYASELKNVCNSLKKYTKLEMEHKYRILLMLLLHFPKVYNLIIRKCR